jgi:hypothetical protein
MNAAHARDICEYAVAEGWKAQVQRELTNVLYGIKETALHGDYKLRYRFTELRYGSRTFGMASRELYRILRSEQYGYTVVRYSDKVIDISWAYANKTVACQPARVVEPIEGST